MTNFNPILALSYHHHHAVSCMTFGTGTTPLHEDWDPKQLPPEVPVGIDARLLPQVVEQFIGA